MVTNSPGITVAQLSEALGLKEDRTGVIVKRLEVEHIRRNGEPPARR